MTYKGEDISNIEITSDQDSGGRAKCSYNYRIVMSKGNSTMDMRGRCSAVSYSLDFRLLSFNFVYNRSSLVTTSV